MKRHVRRIASTTHHRPLHPPLAHNPAVFGMPRRLPVSLQALQALQVPSLPRDPDKAGERARCPESPAIIPISAINRGYRRRFIAPRENYPATLTAVK